MPTPEQQLAELANSLADDVVEALSAATPGDRQQLLEVLAVTAFANAYRDAGGTGAGMAKGTAFANAMTPALALLVPDGTANQHDRVTKMLAHGALNAATAAAAGPDTKFEWRTQRDDRVRDTHSAIEGQMRAAGDPFDVGGHPLMYPGQPVGPPEIWMNCRCFLAKSGSFVAAVEDVPGPDQIETPAPQQHTSTVVVARPQNPEGLAVEGGLPPEELHVTLGFYGETAELDPEVLRLLEVFVANHALQTDATVAGRAMIGFDDPQAVVLLLESPALAEARATLEKVAKPDMTHPHFTPHMTLGYGIDLPQEHPDSVTLDRMELWKGDDRFAGPPAEAVPRETEEPEIVARAFSTDERDKLADKGHAMDDGSFPIANEQDLRNAIQAIGRAKDPEAAKAHIRKRASALGLSELIPESWQNRTADGTELTAAPGTHDAPGWITNPRETQRLRTYWTREEGAAKIGWGSPGDLTRCAEFLSEYVEPNYVWGTCQNLHFEALGYWNPESEGGHDASLADINAAITAAFGTAHDLEDPVLPSLSLFEDPQLEGPTPQTIRAAGDYLEYVGHLAAWGTCHTGISGECVQAPRTASGYAHFRLGEVETDGGFVPVGHITIGTGHAPTNLSASDTVAHYDNTGTVAADVAVGEDEYGIWAHGIVRPGLSDDQVHALRAGVPSGDWRRLGGNLELVAALTVNVPGFPIPRPELAAAAGRDLALVAAGVVTMYPSGIDEDRVVVAVNRALDEREARRARAVRAAAVSQTLNTERVDRLLALVES